MVFRRWAETDGDRHCGVEGGSRGECLGIEDAYGKARPGKILTTTRVGSRTTRKPLRLVKEDPKRMQRGHLVKMRCIARDCGDNTTLVLRPKDRQWRQRRRQSTATLSNPRRRGLLLAAFQANHTRTALGLKLSARRALVDRRS